MNKRIRSLIDGIFSEMKMTAENLALRDELMANAQARYEDAIAQGKTEEEAFAEVAVSLEDVGDLLGEMNKGTAQEGDEPPVQEGEAAGEEAPGEHEAEAAQTDLGDALNKAFTVLGDWGQSIMPQAKKIARQMDDATGGVLSDLGRAVNKGMRDAQKAAGDVLDRMQQEKTPDMTAEEMREEAKDLMAQADLKRAVGDEDGAATLEKQAEELNTQAEIREQAEEMKKAQTEAAQENPQDCVYGADGELDEDAFARSVEEMSREAEDIVRDAQDAAYGKDEGQAREMRFSAAGLRKVDVKLDADDVTIEPAPGEEIIVRWTAISAEEAPAVTFGGHTLSIRRRNPDVFKTFFSVFSKDGGQITIGVPRGFAADYALSTTSGDVILRNLDADDVKITTTSGSVRVEPDAAVRARSINVKSVSGSVTVSARAEDICAGSVSGEVFISCEADSVKGDVVSGKLHVEGAADQLDLNAVSGETKLICTAVPTGKIKADTLSGSVLILLPDSVRGFAVEFNTMSGQMANEFGPKRYGTCALPIHVDTVSGSLTIARL